MRWESGEVRVEHGPAAASPSLLIPVKPVVPPVVAVQNKHFEFLMLL